jgi:hypothetical protein
MPAANPIHREWYGRSEWKKRRARHMQIEPVCRHCAAIGLVKPATICDHIDDTWNSWKQFITAEVPVALFRMP